jgi:hypothetical protein
MAALPPSVPPEVVYPSTGSSFAEPLQPPFQATGLALVGPEETVTPLFLDEPALAPPIPPPGREGVFQGVDFVGTWIPALGDDSLGISDLELSTTLGFPMFTRESPLLVTPRFAVRYFDGPISPDLPSRVYDASVQFRHLRQLCGDWAMDVAIQPGVYSDFEEDDADALRISGHGLAVLQWSPVVKLVMGVVYLDRFDVGLLPAGGIIWIPSDWWRFELVAPRPRIAWRVDDMLDPCAATWCYVAGEFGGGAWSIVRASGAHDEFSIQDYRAILGVEREIIGGLSSRFEVGYVFGRTVEYRSSTPDFEPDDSLLVRLGASY